MKKKFIGALIALTTTSLFANENIKLNNIKINQVYMNEEIGVLNGKEDAAIKIGQRHIFKTDIAPIFSDISFSGSLRTQIDLNAKLYVLNPKNSYSLFYVGSGIERFYRDFNKVDYKNGEEQNEKILFSEHIKDFKISKYIELGYGFTAFENRAYFGGGVRAGTEKSGIEINAEYAPKGFKNLCFTANVGVSYINIEGIKSKETVPTLMIGLTQSF